MSGRYRTVALQAVGVAVIAAIIFIAFLRPDEPGSLSGIDAPGGEEQPIVNTPPKDSDRKKRKRADENERRGDRQGQSQGSGGNGLRSGNDGTGTGDDDSFGDDTPPDDQYDDLVTRLMMKVGEPTLFRELEPGP